MALQRPVSDQDVLTLSDLDNWETDHTWLAVLGHPIRHSLSPAMHNAALAELARTLPEYRTWRYVRFDVPPEDLPVALDKLHARGFRGLNLTVPHKVMAFSHVGRIDPLAQPIGAVNTLLSTEQGWAGFNTDGYGLSTGLRETLGLDLVGATVVLLGAGGAARGAAVEFLQRRCASVWLANRTPERLEALLAQIRPVAPDVPVHTFDLNDPKPPVPRGAWIVNATFLGMKPDDPSPVDLRRFEAPAGVYDMIYQPPETALLHQARELGIPCANGLSMLVHQGARALEIWTGAEVPVEAMRRAAQPPLPG